MNITSRSDMNAVAVIVVDGGVIKLVAVCWQAHLTVSDPAWAVDNLPVVHASSLLPCGFSPAGH